MRPRPSLNWTNCHVLTAEIVNDYFVWIASKCAATKRQQIFGYSSLSLRNSDFEI